MHPTNRLPRAVIGVVLLGALLSGSLFQVARAQPQPPPAEVPGAPRVSALTVPINGTQRFQMYTKRPIRTVFNQKETIARVSAIPGVVDAVLILGLEPGITRVELTDADGQKEEFDVVVQFDVEYLRSLLKRAVPTANLELIPGSNNTLIIGGTVARAEDIDIVLHTASSVVGGQGGAALTGRIINAMRVGGVQQVQLCVVVARVARSEFRRMAFDFLLSDHNFLFGSTGSGAVVPLTQFGLQSNQLGPFGALTDAPGSPAGAGTNLLMGVINPDRLFGFLSFFQALRDEGIVKLLAEPRLVTLSGREANFLSGGQQAVPTPGGLGVVGVDFQPFGTSLNFLPIVLGNGRIHLEVEPEVSALDAANGVNIQGTIVPGRVTQRVRTTVELEPGQTLMIGGLIQRTTQGTTRKIPCLGDLPFLGVFFRSESINEVEEELVVLVTPHLIDPMSCDQLPKLLPGQETRSPDDFELFLEGILEAPRGPRAVFSGLKYVPAWQNSPTADMYPCAGGKCGFGHKHDGCCGGAGSCGLSGGCGAEGSGGCANGSCGNSPVTGVTNPEAPPQVPVVTQPQSLPAAPVSVQPTAMQEISPPAMPGRTSGAGRQPVMLPSPPDSRR